MSNQQKRGGFFQAVSTEEPGLNINVSFSDNLNDTEYVLIQIGPITVRNGYACAYLDKNSVVALSEALLDAEVLVDV